MMEAMAIMVNVVVMGITASASGVVIERIMGTSLSIDSPISTRNPFTFRRLFTMSHSNRPASVSFSRSIFVGRSMLFALKFGGRLSPDDLRF